MSTGATQRTNDADDAVDDESERELSLDSIFDILCVERRRRALRYLQTESNPTTMGEMAEHIASLENDKPERELTSRERKRVYVGLYQCHLPRMNDAGVIDFDSDRKTVALGETADQLTPYLELADEERDEESSDRNWAPFYLGTSVVGGIILLVQTLLFPLAWLSTVLLDGLLIAYFGLSLAHVREDGLQLIGSGGR